MKLNVYRWLVVKLTGDALHDNERRLYDECMKYMEKIMYI